MENLKIIYKKVEDLIPYENNPRNNEKSVDYVANSIKEFGFKVPIIIDKDNIVIAGHTRLKASEKLKLEEVPCIVATDLTEEQITAFRLADNKVGEGSEWNKDLLNLELDELYGIFDMSDFGFNLQIENIDEENKGEEEIAVELGEANNYIVLVFDTEDEWEEAMNVFKIKRVQTCDNNKKIRRFGYGRVIKGKPVMEKLEGVNNEY